MKKLLLILASVAAVAAYAGFNVYQQSTLLTLAPAQRIAQGADTTAVSTTNGPYDMTGFLGIASVGLTVTSNTLNSSVFVPSLTVTIQTCVNGTNETDWATITDAALSTAATIGITNWGSGYGTNSFGVINSYLAPGTQFTNTCVWSNRVSGFREYGLIIDSESRYIRIITEARGSNTIWGFGATLRSLHRRGY